MAPEGPSTRSGTVAKTKINSPAADQQIVFSNPVNLRHIATGHYGGPPIYRGWKRE